MPDASCRQHDSALLLALMLVEVRTVVIVPVMNPKPHPAYILVIL